MQKVVVSRYMGASIGMSENLNMGISGTARIFLFVLYFFFFFLYFMIQKGRETPRRSSRARSTRGQANEAWALYKSNPSRLLSWVDLSKDRYIA